MTFWQWLKKQRQRQDAVGDFARDAMRDKCAVGNRNSVEWWREHLSAHHAPCPGAWRALSDAWAEFNRA
jgi:hypothetical protein